MGPRKTPLYKSAVLFISDCEQGWVAVDRLGKVPFEKARPYYTDKALNRLEIEYRNMSGKPPMVVCNSSADHRVFAPPTMSYVFMACTTYGMQCATGEPFYSYNEDEDSPDFYIITIRHHHPSCTNLKIFKWLEYFFGWFNMGQYLK